MAKLTNNTNSALLGTGMNVLAKLEKVQDIKTIPELENVFSKQDKVIEDIALSMQNNSYNKEEPIVIAKLPDGSILGVADGHTRLHVAKKIGLEEIPVVYKTFENIDAAIQYAQDRQFKRRNLSQSEIYAYAVQLDNQLNKTEKKGEGRATEKLAKKLGVSASTLQHARTVHKRADEETKAKLKNNEVSIAYCYDSVKIPKKKKTEGESSKEPEHPESKLPEKKEAHIENCTAEMTESTSMNTTEESFAAGFRIGWEAGASAIFEKIEEMVASGSQIKKIMEDEIFSDFSFSEIAKKFSIPISTEEIVKNFINKE